MGDDVDMLETDPFSPRGEDDHEADKSIAKMRMEDIRSYFVE